MRAVVETRQIGRDLASALEGLDNAQIATANIDARVAGVHAQMLGIGLNGIASGLAAIRQALTTAQGNQAAVASKARTCSGPISSIGEDSTPKDVITQLSAVAATAGAAASATVGLIEEYGAIRKRIAATLDGGRPEKLLALVDAMVDTLLVPARHRFQAVKDGAEAAVIEARKAGQLVVGSNSAGLDLSPPKRFESIGDQVPDPGARAGAQLQSSMEKGPGGEPPIRTARARRKNAADAFTKVAGDLQDFSKDTAGLVKTGLSIHKPPPEFQPPTQTHASVTQPSVPISINAPPTQLNAVDAVGNVVVSFVALIVGTEHTGSLIAQKWKRRHHDG